MRRGGHFRHHAHDAIGAVSAPAAGSTSEALSIAANRFALGEITKELYDEMRVTLGG